MPDWLVHIGTSYVLGGAARIRYIKYFIIGSILPDFTRMFLILSLDIFHVNEFFFLKYLEPHHTPFLVIILIAGLASIFYPV